MLHQVHFRVLAIAPRGSHHEVASFERFNSMRRTQRLREVVPEVLLEDLALPALDRELGPVLGHGRVERRELFLPRC